MSFGGDKKKAETGISQSGDQVYGAGKMTPEEQSQYLGSFQTGDFLNKLMQYYLGAGQSPAGYVSPEEQYLRQSGKLGASLYETALTSAQNPYASYESTLQPQLQMAEDYINRSAQNRGLLRSGIPIEQMGRAGVELAIAEADKRMQYRNQELARAGTMADVITQTGGQNLANLQNLYQFQQGQGQSAMGRQAGSGQAAGQYWAYPYQAQLGNIYGTQQGLIKGGVDIATNLLNPSNYIPLTGGKKV